MKDQEITLGELVVENPARSRVLEALGLDYCCGGRVTLRAACTTHGLAIDGVEAQLAACDTVAVGDVNPATLSRAELVDYIVRTHHDYLRRELPRLQTLLDRVVRAHGESKPFLLELAALYPPFRAELEEHLAKEEQVLFPWIVRQGATAALGGPIGVMEAEHLSAGTALARFRTLTDGYATPTDACGTYRALMDGLATLETDLHQHVHLENNILFPRALGSTVG